MTGRAAFAQSFMLEHDTLRLRTMATRALFIQTRHCESARGLHHVAAVRVVALHAVHLPFTHRMMLRKIELSMNFEMTRETRLRIASRIHNEFFTLATDCDVFTSGTVTRFASRTAGHLRSVNVQPRVWSGGEDACVLGMAVGARGIPDKRGTGNIRRWRDISFDR